MGISNVAREQAEDAIEGLEGLISRGVQSVYLDIAISGMRQLLAAMDSDPLAVTDDELNAALQLHRLKVDGHSQLSDAFRAGFRYARRTTPQPAPVVPDYFASLVAAARIRADKAMRKFPQPNYVLNKVAEESGEVIKAVIHYTEGREEWSNVESEIIDNLAMLLRLVKEGDQVIGFTPPDSCRAAMLQTGNSPAVQDGSKPKSELLQRAEKIAEDAAALVERVGGATCEWSFDGQEHSWNGKCGASWLFFEDGPNENRMRFCPGCGKPVLIAYQPEGE
nr:MAG TPA: NTP-PPase-like protein [Caudoviricetes sp.]